MLKIGYRKVRLGVFECESGVEIVGMLEDDEREK